MSDLQDAMQQGQIPGTGTVGRPAILDYDRLVFEDERIEARAIVKTVRRFEATVRNGIARLDEDEIF